MQIRLIAVGAWSTLLVLPALFVARPGTPEVSVGSSPGWSPGEAAPAGARFVWGDYDADGLDDAFAILDTGQSGLLHNEGDGTLRDVTTEAGLGGMHFAGFAAWRDVDGDGALDLLVAAREGTHLFRNRDGAFEDVASTLGLAEQRGVTSAHWLDYDADGRADLHLTTRAGDVLLRATPGGHFERARVPALPNRSSSRTTGAAAAAQGGQKLVISNPPGVQHVGVVAQNFHCPDAIVDQADGVTCMSASSQPTPGFLYPLTRNLFVTATGEVGVNTINPQARLHVNGADSTMNGQSGALFRGGVGGPAGGRGATIIGGYSQAFGGDGLTVTGGDSRTFAGDGIVVEGGYAELSFSCVGGDGARISGGDVRGGTDYARGGAGAVIVGGYVGGYLSDAGAGAVITGGETPPQGYTLGYTYSGAGAEITGGDGGYAGDGAVLSGGDGFKGGRGAVIRAGVGTSIVQTALRVEGRAPLNLAIQTVGDIETAGNICATGAIGVCSDERFKEDVQPLRDALATVLALRGVSYDWKVDAFPERAFTDERQVGFLAQQALAVVPEIVSQDSEGYYAVDYSKLTPVLVEAIREQQAELDALRTRVEQLEALEEKIAALTASMAVK